MLNTPDNAVSGCREGPVSVAIVPSHAVESVRIIKGRNPSRFLILGAGEIFPKVFVSPRTTSLTASCGEKRADSGGERIS